MKAKLLGNKRGISTLISDTLILCITVMAMIIVIGTSFNFITASNEQIGERLYIERFTYNATHINLYVRNVGHSDITLKYYILNGTETRYFNSRIYVPPPEANPLAKVTRVPIARETGKKVYLISLFSSRFNEFKVEVDLS